MPTVSSTLTSKFQATIPLDIRRFLELHQGDKVQFVVEKDRVLIQKAPPMDQEYFAAVASGLQEWLSDADNEVFGTW
jgi:AbrB family looped-hinge helix DNA binding protein